MRLLLILLPLLLLGVTRLVPESTDLPTCGTGTTRVVPCFNGSPSPIWVTSWENTGVCTADDGNPNATASCLNDADNNYAGVAAFEGGDSMRLFDDADTDESVIASAITDTDEIWVKMWVRILVYGTLNNELMLMQNDGTNFAIWHLAAGGKIDIACPSGQLGGGVAVDINNWYIVYAHFDDDGAGVGSGELEVWSNATPPVQVGVQQTCTGNLATDKVMTGWNSKSRSGRSMDVMIDCLEIYDADPGSPTTRDCHPDTLGQ